MAHGGAGAHIDDPARWLGRTPLLDLEDPKVALKVKSLTQLIRKDREKALALYGFVKRIPFSMGYRVGAVPPREVLRRGTGAAPDKVGLLVAMLRIAGVPARVRIMLLDRDFLQGFKLFSRTPRTVRCVLEAWVDGDWRRTDTYMYDAAYVAGAKARLAAEGWERGWGVHASGDTVWDARGDAYLVGAQYARANLVPSEQAVFSDGAEMLASSYVLQTTYGALPHVVVWNASTAANAKTVLKVRGGGELPHPGGDRPCPTEP